LDTKESVAGALSEEPGPNLTTRTLPGIEPLKVTVSIFVGEVCGFLPDGSSFVAALPRITITGSDATFPNVTVSTFLLFPGIAVGAASDGKLAIGSRVGSATLDGIDGGSGSMAATEPSVRTDVKTPTAPMC
jgi:hypothetical protein